MTIKLKSTLITLIQTQHELNMYKLYRCTIPEKQQTQCIHYSTWFIPNIGMRACSHTIKNKDIARHQWPSEIIKISDAVIVRFGDFKFQYHYEKPSQNLGYTMT